MAGIYIHIPFCKKACHYCNFHFSTFNRLQQDFIASLLQEIEPRKTYITEPLSTIYFGGGTPSILPSIDIKRILTKIAEECKVDEGIEITLEANPDDITKDKLQ